VEESRNTVAVAEALRKSRQGKRNGALKGIRIPVAALKGRCPRPLDDEGAGNSVADLELPGNESNENLEGCACRYGYTANPSRPIVSGKPSIRFMFWMACPAAPLTKLSRQLMTISLPVRWSIVG
jgi:hypothetical protein